jgi:hypothetical protein
MDKMTIGETNEYLQSLVVKVADDLISIYSQSNQLKEPGLIFPRKRDGSVRVSEQESKHLFLHHAKTDNRFCFSVETPTSQRYRQSGVSEISARVDLTLSGQAGPPLVHIELKAHYCGIESIRKDLEKLIREDTTGVWFHTLERGGGTRVESLLATFRTAFGLLSDYLENSKRSYLITICLLDAGLVYWRWLNLTGDLNLNLAAIENTFQASSLLSGEWQMVRFGTDQPNDRGDDDASFIRSNLSVRRVGEPDFELPTPQTLNDSRRGNMELKPGMWVRHPRLAGWGTGKILTREGEWVRIIFSEVGEKLIDLRFVTLEELEAPANAMALRPRVRDMSELEQLCLQFHGQFKDRRKTTDDGSMALKVLEDIRERGNLTKSTARQLFSWCHTGASYAEGVDLAQQICGCIYGRVPSRPEIEEKGLR